jgi:hypothetical protein
VSYKGNQTSRLRHSSDSDAIQTSKMLSMAAPIAASCGTIGTPGLLVPGGEEIAKMAGYRVFIM